MSARAQKSPTAKAALTRAVTDLGANRFAQAAAEMETAVRFEPRFAFGWYLLASSQRRAGNCDRAVAAYRRYAELRPNHPDPHFGLGLCLESIGDRGAALTSFRRYADTDTRSEWAEFVTQAREHIVALESDHAAAPGTPVAAAKAHEKAGQLIATHNYPEAANDLRAGIKDAPADAAAWYKLAFALRESNQPEEAAKAYRRYITLKPDDPDPYYGLGHVLLASGHPDEALVAFRAYVKLAPVNSDSRWVGKARAEIAHLESARRASMAAGGKGTGKVAGEEETRPGATTPPPAPQPTAPPPPAAPTTPPAAEPSATTAHLTQPAPKTEP
jgi:cytochrome c-type biogenesis protein CcmH/NrfG